MLVSKLSAMAICSAELMGSNLGFLLVSGGWINEVWSACAAWRFSMLRLGCNNDGSGLFNLICLGEGSSEIGLRL